MSAGACANCLRRSWLLSALSVPLDFLARDHDRLVGLLGLPDEQLIEAVGGRRRQSLSIEHAAFAPHEAAAGASVASTCRHRANFPSALRGADVGHALHVLGTPERLQALTQSAVVALAGSRRASDYGIAMARSLARGLTASGVTVTSGLDGAIALAAHMGALEGTGATVAVLGGGLGTWPARQRSLVERIARAGCVIAELPEGRGGRRWGLLAGERVMVGLASVTIVIEARDSAWDLAAARLAGASGRTVAALPGRVTSPLSCGTNAMLMAGAKLVRGTEDVLDLLCELDAPVTRDGPPRPSSQKAPTRSIDARRSRSLEPRLKHVLDRVGAGADTPEKLADDGPGLTRTLLALSELELMGLLSRGDGGRYVPNHGLPC